MRIEIYRDKDRPEKLGQWVCVSEDYDGAPDSGHVIGTGKTRSEALLDFIEMDGLGDE